MTNLAEIDLARTCEQRAAAEAVKPGDPGSDSAFILKCLAANEDGDAYLFNHLHGGRFVFDHAAGTWFEWTGHSWAEDLKNHAMAGIDATVDQYATEANRQAWAATKAEKQGKTDEAKKHKSTQDVLLKRIRALQSALRKKNVLFLATVGRGLSGTEWDRAEMLLACKNSVLDLKTGEHRPGQQEDYIKTACPTEWRGLEAPCPMWEKFLSEVFDGDREIIGYLQRLFGYGLTGKTTLHTLPILCGAGRNGKGTMLETLKHVLGDYAYKAEAELLLEQRFAKASGAPNSGLLSLRGKRMVWVSETNEGRRLNAARVKELVGGDTLNARAVYGRRHVEFRPAHLLLLMTNNRPQAPAGDYALWQRIHLIPFEQAFVANPTKSNEHPADPALSEKLRSEASGILAWLVRGCLTWQAEGLNPPEVVTTATQAYQTEEDLFGHFISDRCVLDAKAQVKASEFYKSYRQWCDDNGHRPVSGTKFGKEMKLRFDFYRPKAVFYLGIGLLND